MSPKRFAVIGVALALASGAARAQVETATYTMTFEGLWTADDITDASLPGDAHFTQVIGATHNSSTTIWVSGGTASAGVENVAELGSTGTLVSEIGANANADAVVRAGSSFTGPTQTVSGTFTVKTSHPLVSVLSMVAPTPDWFVGVSNLSLYDNGWRNRVVELFPYDAGTEEGSGWSLSNADTVPRGVIASIRNSGRFRGNPIARLRFSTDETSGGGTVSPVTPPVAPPVMVEPRSVHYTIPLMVSPGPAGGALGVLRILNDTAESGPVDIYAIDDSGTLGGPATFTLGARAAAEFTAADLRSGNAVLDLSGGVGAARDARLLIATDLRKIVPLVYVRAPDGTLSAMHDTVRAEPPDDSGQYRYEVPVFNPSTEAVQASRLRLINPGEEQASVTIGARDDSGGEATGGGVTLMLTAGAAKTLTARQLEVGDSSISGRLGAGVGKWRLRVSSDQPLQVVNIAVSASGYWNNLSTTAAAGEAQADSSPRFAEDSGPGDQAYTAGTMIATLTLPEASGGNGVLSYGLSPDVQGLSFDADTRQLSGTPSTAGRYSMTYTVTDEDGDSDTLDFSIAVNSDSTEPGPLGECYAGLWVRIAQSCTYPGTTDEFSVNERGRASFLTRLAGIRIRIDNETINGRVYDFAAEHQGDGVWRIDRLAGSM